MLDQVVPARPKQVLDQTGLQPGRELGDRVADVTHRHEREQRPDDQRADEKHDQGADVERQPHGVGPAAGKLDHRRGLRLRGIGHDPEQRDQAGEADALDHAGHQQAAQHGPRVDPLRLEEQSNDVAQVSRRTLGSCRVAASGGPSTAWLARPGGGPSRSATRRTSATTRRATDTARCLEGVNVQRQPRRQARATRPPPTRRLNLARLLIEKDVWYAWLPKSLATKPYAPRGVSRTRPRRFGTLPMRCALWRRAEAATGQPRWSSRRPSPERAPTACARRNSRIGATSAEADQFADSATLLRSAIALARFLP